MSFCYNLDKDKFDEFCEFLDENIGKKGAIMPVLQKCQNLFSYIPEPIVDLMALKLGVSSSEIYGVATFYSQFSLKPKGEHEICVCLGTACYVKGSDKILKSLSDELGIEVGDTTEDGKISLAEARCIGQCGIAPVVSIDGNLDIGNLSSADVHKIILKAKEMDHEQG